MRSMMLLVAVVMFCVLAGISIWIAPTIKKVRAVSCIEAYKDMNVMYYDDWGMCRFRRANSTDYFPEIETSNPIFGYMGFASYYEYANGTKYVNSHVDDVFSELIG